jgi:signal transduction histidine kinase
MRKLPSIIVIAVVVWWALNGLISTVQLLAVFAARGRAATVQDVLLSEMGRAALWVLFTLWLLWWTARTPLERERWLKPLVSLLLATLAVAVCSPLAVMALHPSIGWYNPAPRWNDVLVGNMFRDFMRGCVIVGVGHALVYARRARARETHAKVLQEQLTKARLDALSAQLNPHFLFNALNSIAEMVHHDADAADRMLVQLGGLLRHSLETSRQQHTSLHEELDIVEAYIGIEQVRLGDRLRFHRDISQDVLAAQVPRLMLQPLVENAITHVVAHRSSPSKVEVRAWCEGDRLVLEVLDEGTGKRPEPGFGIGLANTRARLECLYGDDQELDIMDLPGGGTRVRVKLPLKAGPRDG